MVYLDKIELDNATKGTLIVEKRDGADPEATAAAAAAAVFKLGQEEEAVSLLLEAAFNATHPDKASEVQRFVDMVNDATLEEMEGEYGTHLTDQLSSVPLHDSAGPEGTYPFTVALTGPGEDGVPREYEINFSVVIPEKEDRTVGNFIGVVLANAGVGSAVQVSLISAGLKY